ncbi:hypothetical protein ACFQV2_30565 [Actinokineospora soli]|uniref:Integral membrane protein n=1 Tax=Actinokineospora soli TaxID=1048753 RepID=A0ABW2TWD9_9PSEU
MDAMETLPCPKVWRRPDGTPRQESTPSGMVCTVAAHGETGLLFPSRGTRRAAAFVLVGVGLVLALLSGFLVTAEPVIAVVGGVVLGLLGVLLIAAGLFALRHRPLTTGLLMTPEGVALTWLRPAVRLGWDDIHEIRPLVLRMGRSAQAPSRHYVGVVSRGKPDVGERMRKVAVRFGPDVACAVPVGSLDVDQLVVLHTLAYYRDHPEARAELAGDAAVLRVREVRLRAPE